jgi:hypothetical protein
VRLDDERLDLVRIDDVVRLEAVLGAGFGFSKLVKKSSLSFWISEGVLAFEGVAAEEVDTAGDNGAEEMEDFSSGSRSINEGFLQTHINPSIYMKLIARLCTYFMASSLVRCNSNSLYFDPAALEYFVLASLLVEEPACAEKYSLAAWLPPTFIVRNWSHDQLSKTVDLSWLDIM